MAGIQYALGIWRIYSVPVGFCGSTAGQLDLADPLFYRCLFADLLRIDCGPGRRSIWRIYCMPVVFWGSTAGQLDLAEPLFYRRLFADLLRIDGGPVDRSGWFTVGPLDFEDLLRAYWTSLADLLRSCRILLKLLEIRCGADLRAYQSCFLIGWIRHAKLNL